MYSLIGFSGSVIVEAFVYQTSKNRMRAVVAGLRDALELRRLGSGWISEYGETVTFEFVGFDAAAAISAPQALASSAAG